MTLPAATIDFVDPTERESNLIIPVQDAITIYNEAPVSQGTIDFGTSAGRGYLTNFKRALGHKYRGRFSTSDLPPAFLSDGTLQSNYRTGSGTNIKGKAIFRGFQERAATVVGSSAVTDAGSYFWVLEDGTFTLTPPSIDTEYSSIPDGEVIRWLSGTTCHILEWSAEFKSILEAAGGIFYYLTFSLPWTGVADGKLRDNFRMNHYGKIVEAFAINDVALSGSGGTLVANASLAGTNISTSGITLSTAATPAQAAKTSLTLLDTSARETYFHQGTLLDIDISSSGGTRTTGLITLYFRIMCLLGL